MDSINCTLGGNKLFPKEGYWRFNENSTRFLKCPKEIACIGASEDFYGSQEFSTGVCAEGYEGPLCDSCSNGYSAIYNKCIKCTNANILLGLLTVLIPIFVKINCIYFGT